MKLLNYFLGLFRKGTTSRKETPWQKCSALLQEIEIKIMDIQAITATHLQSLPAMDPWASKVAEIERDLAVLNNRTYNLTQFYGALQSWVNNSPISKEKRNDVTESKTNHEINQEADELDRLIAEARLQADIRRTTPD